MQIDPKDIQNQYLAKNPGARVVVEAEPTVPGLTAPTDFQEYPYTRVEMPPVEDPFRATPFFPEQTQAETAPPPPPPPPPAAPLPEPAVDPRQVRVDNWQELPPIPRPEGVPNVTEVFLRRVQSLGVERTAFVTKRPVTTVQRWIEKKTSPTLSDLQAFLDQPEQEEWRVNRACLHLDAEKGVGALWSEKPKLPVAVMICSNRNVSKPVMMSMLATVKNDDVQVFYSDQPILIHSRNELAKRLLDSANQYGLFWDDDIFPPFGNPHMFRTITQSQRITERQASFNSLHRLLSHRKDIVGAVYASRKKNGPLTIQPDLAPKNLQDREISDKIRKGQAGNELIEVDWLATGYVLIHRRVFETILSQGLATWDRDFPTFFNPVNNEGEDFAFCLRARKAGFKHFIDPALEVGHIGRQVFLAEDSRRLP
jgi:hypothetical protein